MAGVPRSQALIVHNWAETGFSGYWTSPAGYITLVKSMHGSNSGATDAAIVIIAYEAGTGVRVDIASVTMVAGTHGEWNGWVALNPGDQIVLFSSVVSTSAWLSGAVLAGPNQFPPATRKTVTQLPVQPPDVASPR